MKVLITTLLLLTILTGMGLAAELEHTVISPSGGQNLSSPNYKIELDIKGQPVIGESTSLNYKVELGGLHGLLGPSVVEAAGVAWGSVPLDITQDGNNIRLEWPASYGSSISIYALTGTNDWLGEFTNNKTNWTLITNIEDHSLENYVLHLNQVNTIDAPQEIYYKALQAGLNKDSNNPNTGENVLETASAVGKIDLEIERADNKISFFSFSVPFISQSGNSFSTIFPTQPFVSADPTKNLLEADQIRGWTGDKWQSFFKSSTDSAWNETKGAVIGLFHVTC